MEFENTGKNINDDEERRVNLEKFVKDSERKVTGWLSSKEKMELAKYAISFGDYDDFKPIVDNEDGIDDSQA